MNSNYVDIHVLQALPPNNINRDDLGNPKTSVYGGVTRARVSSQAWKRAIRNDFKNRFEALDLATLTKRSSSLFINEIRSQNPEISCEEAKEISRKILNVLKAGIDSKKKEELQTNVLLFIGQKQVQELVKAALSGKFDSGTDVNKNQKKGKGKAAKEETDTRTIVKEIMENNPSVETALFGRMFAENPDLNVDAACQVSHAISTHAVEAEIDFFTALDDLEERNQSAYLEPSYFNSALIYRFATIDVRQLRINAGEKTPEIISKFILSFVSSMPSGKMNSFANRTFPNDIYIAVREDQPVNFSPAFENPVLATSHGYSAASAERMMKYSDNINKLIGIEPVFEERVGFNISTSGNIKSVSEAVEAVEFYVKEQLSTDNI